MLIPDHSTSLSPTTTALHLHQTPYFQLWSFLNPPQLFLEDHLSVLPRHLRGFVPPLEARYDSLEAGMRRMGFGCETDDKRTLGGK